MILILQISSVVIHIYIASKREFGCMYLTKFEIMYKTSYACRNESNYNLIIKNVPGN